MDTRKLKREIRKVKMRLDRVIKKSREKEIQRKEKEDPKQMWRMFHRMMGKEKAVIPDKITFKGQAVGGEERYRVDGDVPEQYTATSSKRCGVMGAFQVEG